MFKILVRADMACVVSGCTGLLTTSPFSRFRRRSPCHFDRLCEAMNGIRTAPALLPYPVSFNVTSFNRNQAVD
jgi:hypothetical protein